MAGPFSIGRSVTSTGSETAPGGKVSETLMPKEALRLPPVSGRMRAVTAVSIGVGVADGVAVTEGVAVGVLVGVGVTVRVPVGVLVGDAVFVAVGDGVGVADVVAVTEGVAVGVTVRVPVGVLVGDGVTVAVGVAVSVFTLQKNLKIGIQYTQAIPRKMCYTYPVTFNQPGQNGSK